MTRNDIIMMSLPKTIEKCNLRILENRLIGIAPLLKVRFHHKKNSQGICDIMFHQQFFTKHFTINIAPFHFTVYRLFKGLDSFLRGMYTEYLFICPVPATPSGLGTQFKNIEIFTDAQILIPSNKDLLKRFPDLINPA